jgi:hypothetical protein
MPAGSIDIQPNRIASEPSIKVPENLQKSLSISSFCLHHPIASQQGSHPTRYVQTFLMLARCWNPKPLPNAGPSPTQARMQGKTGLVLENHGLFRTQGLEFFLIPFQISEPLRPSLADKHGRHASACTLTDASSSGPGAPSALFQTAVANELPAWDHPIAPGLIHRPEGIPPSASPTAWRASKSIERVVLAGVSLLNSLLLSRLCLESIDSSSCGSNQAPRQSSSAAALRLPAEVRQSSGQPTLQEWFWPRKLNAPLLLPDVLCLSLS